MVTRRNVMVAYSNSNYSNKVNIVSNRFKCKLCLRVQDLNDTLAKNKTFPILQIATVLGLWETLYKMIGSVLKNGEL